MHKPVTNTHHSVFGPSFAEQGWVPAPRYILRRALVMQALGSLPTGSVLEIGYGSGAMLHELHLRGWHCTGVEESGHAEEIAQHVLHGKNITLLNDLPATQHNVVIAMEVLEHVEDDSGILHAWAERLLPGGTLILSVPAHQKRWTPSDEYAGHFRRYERAQLTTLLEQCGFEVERMDCYGWPLANITAIVRTLRDARRMRHAQNTSKHELTHASGIDRSLEKTIFAWYHNKAGSALFKVLLQLQRMAFRREWGNGYVAVARKR